MRHHPGQQFRELANQQQALQIVGTVNAYHAMLAKQSGHQAIYLSGGGVAACMGLPDLGITQLEDILIDTRRITDSCDLPLLVDVDTGFGVSFFNVARTTKSLIKAGAAAMHIEDQAGAKRCGHRPNKMIVSIDEMVDRIKAAVDARTDASFVIMARTDAFANEGLESAIERAQRYVEAGADMIFPEAISDLTTYQHFTQQLQVPILANITEFGQTPLFTRDELSQVGIKLILYPLSAFRAMNLAALNVFETIKQEGTQKNCVAHMQTRQALYQTLDYHRYEEALDQLNQGKKDD